MKTMSKATRAIIGAVVVVLVIVVAIVSMRTPGTNPASGNGTDASLNAGSPTQTPGHPSSGTSGSVTTGSQVTKTSITITAPVKNATWKIATPNIISWSKAGNFSGDIYLVDAKTKAFVGVILPQTGPQQTYYEWNTRDIFLDRTSPLKKTVLPGTYLVKIAFDGNNLPIIASPAITITN
jgi:hypothetical protein